MTSIFVSFFFMATDVHRRHFMTGWRLKSRLFTIQQEMDRVIRIVASGCERNIYVSCQYMDVYICSPALCGKGSPVLIFLHGPLLREGANKTGKKKRTYKMAAA